MYKNHIVFINICVKRWQIYTNTCKRYKNVGVINMSKLLKQKSNQIYLNCFYDNLFAIIYFVYKFYLTRSSIIKNDRIVIYY